MITFLQRSRSMIFVIVFPYIAGCNALICGKGTVEVDGICQPERNKEETQSSTAACNGVEIFEVDVEDNPQLVLEKSIEVALTGIADIAVTCSLTEDSNTEQYSYEEVIPAGNEWSYLDNGADPGEPWAQLYFLEAGWRTGTAPLGYGATGIETFVQFGTNADKNITTFFRHHFSLNAAALSSLSEGGDYDTLRVKLWIDDGAAIYLNGTEIDRYNLPSGMLTIDTLATTSIETTVVTFDLDRALLLEGDNVIAVRTHQQSNSSSDLYFDLALEGGVLTKLDNSDEYHSIASLEPAPFHEISLNGLLADSTYDCTVSVGCADQPITESAFSFQTDPLPSHIPEFSVEVIDANRSFGDYTLFNQMAACGTDRDMYFYIVDSDGNVRWYYQAPGIDSTGAMDLEVNYLGDGKILWGGEDRAASPRIVTLSHDIDYVTWYEGAGEEHYHHDVVMLDNGHIAGLTDTYNTDGSEWWLGFGIVQHDPVEKEVTWFWDSQQGADQGALPTSSNYGDVYHANSFALADDDESEGFFVSLLYTDTIIRIDKNSGDVLYTLGRGADFELIDTDGNSLPNSEWWTGLHAIEVNDNRVLMLDNGWDRGQSRAVEYALDSDTMTATLVWEFDDEFWYDTTWGDADELENGNVLITISNSDCSGHNQGMLEVDRITNKIVSRLDVLDSQMSGYRAQRLDGCEIFTNSRFCPEK